MGVLERNVALTCRISTSRVLQSVVIRVSRAPGSFGNVTHVPTAPFRPPQGAAPEIEALDLETRAKPHRGIKWVMVSSAIAPGRKTQIISRCRPVSPDG
ncbi:hypothetical protein AAFF_G00134890 [Aldrovandia affinis]|uniref:Uncharacterized protein n=1 Tax=Aldrovandia affinis TaxID=143900 RepID=A0AAD7W9F6_9TELE|nr:hypothetical protein AAFF_G00134890 [Aldrovandia affinis]